MIYERWNRWDDADTIAGDETAYAHTTQRRFTFFGNQVNFYAKQNAITRNTSETNEKNEKLKNIHFWAAATENMRLCTPAYW